MFFKCALLFLSLFAQCSFAQVVDDTVLKAYFAGQSASPEGRKAGWASLFMIGKVQEISGRPEFAPGSDAYKAEMERTLDIIEEQLEGRTLIGAKTDYWTKWAIGGVGTGVAIVNPPLGLAVGVGGIGLVDLVNYMGSYPALDVDMGAQTSLYFSVEAAKRAMDSSRPESVYFDKLLKRFAKTNVKNILDIKPPSNDREAIELAAKLNKKDPKLYNELLRSRSKAEAMQVLDRRASEMVVELGDRLKKTKEELSKAPPQQAQSPEREAAEIIKKDHKDREEAEKSALIRANITETFGAMSGAAYLFHDHESAQKMAKMGQAAGLGFDLVRTLTKEGAFAKNPAGFFNTAFTMIAIIDSIFSAGQPSELSQVMAQIQILKEMILDLRKTMLEEFQKLNIKVDGYFIKTSGALSRLEAGQAYSEGLLQSILEEISKMREDLINGLSLNVKIYAKERIYECLGVDPKTKLPRPFAQGQGGEKFEKCRNFFADAAVGKYRHSPEGLPKFEAVPGVLEYVYSLSKKIIGNQTAELPESFNPYQWFWGTSNILKLAKFHPEYGQYLNQTFEDTESGTSLKDLYSAGEAYKKYIESLVQKSGERSNVRGELFRAILDQYEISVRKALDAADLVRAKNEDGGPRFGLTFKKFNDLSLEGLGIQKFKIVDLIDRSGRLNPKYEFLNVNVKMCPNAKTTFTSARINPSLTREYIEGPGMGRRYSPFYIKDSDIQRLLTFPEEGLKLNANFAKFFPDSVVYAAQQNANSIHSGMNVELFACFDRWETTKAYHFYDHNVTEIAVGIQLGMYYSDDKEVEVQKGQFTRSKYIFLRRLDGKVERVGRGEQGGHNYDDNQVPVPVAMWRGIKSNPDHQTYDSVAWDPSWLTPSDIANPAELSDFEMRYSQSVKNRNERAAKDLTMALQDRSLNTELHKSAMIYINQFLDSKNDVVQLFDTWLKDDTHLPAPQLVAAVWVAGLADRAELEAKVARQRRMADIYVEALAKQDLRPTSQFFLEDRINQLKRLENDLEEKPQSKKDSRGGFINKIRNLWSSDK